MIDPIIRPGLLLYICCITSYGLSHCALSCCGNVPGNYGVKNVFGVPQSTCLVPWCQNYCSNPHQVFTSKVPTQMSGQPSCFTPEERSMSQERRIALKYTPGNYMYPDIPKPYKTPIHACLAGYDGDIYEIIKDIKETHGDEIEVHFYLFFKCKFNFLESHLTNIKALQEVLAKHHHYICLNKKYLETYNEKEHCWYIEKLIMIPGFKNNFEIIPKNIKIQDFTKLCNVCNKKVGFEPVILEIGEKINDGQVRNIALIRENENKYELSLDDINKLSLRRQNDRKAICGDSMRGYNAQQQNGYTPSYTQAQPCTAFTNQNAPCTQTPNYWSSNIICQQNQIPCRTPINNKINTLISKPAYNEICMQRPNANIVPPCYTASQTIAQNSIKEGSSTCYIQPPASIGAYYTKPCSPPPCKSASYYITPQNMAVSQGSSKICYTQPQMNIRQDSSVISVNISPKKIDNGIVYSPTNKIRFPTPCQQVKPCIQGLWGNQASSGYQSTSTYNISPMICQNQDVVPCYQNQNQFQPNYISLSTPKAKVLQSYDTIPSYTPKLDVKSVEYSQPKPCRSGINKITLPVQYNAPNVKPPINQICYDTVAFSNARKSKLVWPYTPAIYSPCKDYLQAPSQANLPQPCIYQRPCLKRPNIITTDISNQNLPCAKYNTISSYESQNVFPPGQTVVSYAPSIRSPQIGPISVVSPTEKRPTQICKNIVSYNTPYTAGYKMPQEFETISGYTPQRLTKPSQIATSAYFVPQKDVICPGKVTITPYPICKPNYGQTTVITPEFNQRVCYSPIQKYTRKPEYINAPYKPCIYQRPCLKRPDIITTDISNQNLPCPKYNTLSSYESQNVLPPGQTVVSYAPSIKSPQIGPISVVSPTEKRPTQICKNIVSYNTPYTAGYKIPQEFETISGYTPQRLTKPSQIVSSAYFVPQKDVICPGKVTITPSPICKPTYGQGTVLTPEFNQRVCYTPIQKYTRKPEYINAPYKPRQNYPMWIANSNICKGPIYPQQPCYNRIVPCAPNQIHGTTKYASVKKQQEYIGTKYYIPQPKYVNPKYESVTVDIPRQTKPSYQKSIYTDTASSEMLNILPLSVQNCHLYRLNQRNQILGKVSRYVQSKKIGTPSYDSYPSWNPKYINRWNPNLNTFEPTYNTGPRGYPTKPIQPMHVHVNYQPKGITPEIPYRSINKPLYDTIQYTTNNQGVTIPNYQIFTPNPLKPIPLDTVASYTPKPKSLSPEYKQVPCYTKPNYIPRLMPAKPNYVSILPYTEQPTNIRLNSVSYIPCKQQPITATPNFVSIPCTSQPMSVTPKLNFISTYIPQAKAMKPDLVTVSSYTQQPTKIRPDFVSILPTAQQATIKNPNLVPISSYSSQMGVRSNIATISPINQQPIGIQPNFVPIKPCIQQSSVKQDFVSIPSYASVPVSENLVSTPPCSPQQNIKMPNLVYSAYTPQPIKIQPNFVTITPSIQRPVSINPNVVSIPYSPRPINKSEFKPTQQQIDTYTNLVPTEIKKPDLVRIWPCTQQPIRLRPDSISISSYNQLPITKRPDTVSITRYAPQPISIRPNYVTMLPCTQQPASIKPCNQPPINSVSIPSYTFRPTTRPDTVPTAPCNVLPIGRPNLVSVMPYAEQPTRIRPDLVSIPTFTHQAAMTKPNLVSMSSYTVQSRSQKQNTVSILPCYQKPIRMRPNLVSILPSNQQPISINPCLVSSPICTPRRNNVRPVYDSIPCLTRKPFQLRPTYESIPEYKPCTLSGRPNFVSILPSSQPSTSPVFGPTSPVTPQLMAKGLNLISIPPYTPKPICIRPNYVSITPSTEEPISVQPNLVSVSSYSPCRTNKWPSLVSIPSYIPQPSNKRPNLVTTSSSNQQPINLAPNYVPISTFTRKPCLTPVLNSIPKYTQRPSNLRPNYDTIAAYTPQAMRIKPDLVCTSSYTQQPTKIRPDFVSVTPNIQQPTVIHPGFVSVPSYQAQKPISRKLNWVLSYTRRPSLKPEFESLPSYSLRSETNIPNYASNLPCVQQPTTTNNQQRTKPNFISISSYAPRPSTVRPTLMSIQPCSQRVTKIRPDYVSITPSTTQIITTQPDYVSVSSYSPCKTKWPILVSTPSYRRRPSIVRPVSIPSYTPRLTGIRPNLLPITYTRQRPVSILPCTKPALRLPSNYISVTSSNQQPTGIESNFDEISSYTSLPANIKPKFDSTLPCYQRPIIKMPDLVSTPSYTPRPSDIRPNYVSILPCTQTPKIVSPNFVSVSPNSISIPKYTQNPSYSNVWPSITRPKSVPRLPCVKQPSRIRPDFVSIIPITYKPICINQEITSTPSYSTQPKNLQTDFDLFSTYTPQSITERQNVPCIPQPAIKRPTWGYISSYTKAPTRLRPDYVSILPSNQKPSVLEPGIVSISSYSSRPTNLRSNYVPTQSQINPRPNLVSISSYTPQIRPNLISVAPSPLQPICIIQNSITIPSYTPVRPSLVSVSPYTQPISRLRPDYVTITPSYQQPTNIKPAFLSIPSYITRPCRLRPQYDSISSHTPIPCNIKPVSTPKPSYNPQSGTKRTDLISILPCTIPSTTICPEYISILPSTQPYLTQSNLVSIPSYKYKFPSWRSQIPTNFRPEYNVKPEYIQLTPYRKLQIKPQVIFTKLGTDKVIKPGYYEIKSYTKPCTPTIQPCLISTQPVVPCVPSLPSVQQVNQIRSYTPLRGSYVPSTQSFKPSAQQIKSYTQTKIPCETSVPSYGPTTQSYQPFTQSIFNIESYTPCRAPCVQSIPSYRPSTQSYVPISRSICNIESYTPRRVPCIPSYVSPIKSYASFTQPTTQIKSYTPRPCIQSVQPSDLSYTQSYVPCKKYRPIAQQMHEIESYTQQAPIISFPNPYSPSSKQPSILTPKYYQIPCYTKPKPVLQKPCRIPDYSTPCFKDIYNILAPCEKPKPLQTYKNLPVYTQPIMKPVICYAKSSKQSVQYNKISYVMPTIKPCYTQPFMVYNKKNPQSANQICNKILSYTKPNYLFDTMKYPKISNSLLKYHTMSYKKTCVPYISAKSYIQPNYIPPVPCISLKNPSGEQSKRLYIPNTTKQPYISPKPPCISGTEPYISPIESFKPYIQQMDQIESYTQPCTPSVSFTQSRVPLENRPTISIPKYGLPLTKPYRKPCISIAPSIPSAPCIPCIPFTQPCVPCVPTTRPCVPSVPCAQPCVPCVPATWPCVPSTQPCVPCVPTTQPCVPSMQPCVPCVPATRPCVPCTQPCVPCVPTTRPCVPSVPCTQPCVPCVPATWPCVPSTQPCVPCVPTTQPCVPCTQPCVPCVPTTRPCVPCVPTTQPYVPCVSSTQPCVPCLPTTQPCVPCTQPCVPCVPTTQPCVPCTQPCVPCEPTTRPCVPSTQPCVPCVPTRQPCVPSTQPCVPCVPTTRPCVPCTQPCVPCVLTTRPCVPCVPCTQPCVPCVPTTRPCVPCVPCTQPCVPCVPTTRPCVPCVPCTQPCVPCVPTTQPCVPTTQPCVPCTQPCVPCVPTTQPCVPCVPCTQPYVPCVPTTWPCVPSTQPCVPCVPKTRPCVPCVPSTQPCVPCVPTTRPCVPCVPSTQPCVPCVPTTWPCVPCVPTTQPCVPCVPTTQNLLKYIPPCNVYNKINPYRYSNIIYRPSPNIQQRYDKNNINTQSYETSKQEDNICKEFQRNKIMNVSNIDINSLTNCLKKCMFNTILKSNGNINDLKNKQVSIDSIVIADPNIINEKPFFTQRIDDNLVIKGYMKKVKVLKAKLIFESEDVDVPNFVPVVKCNETRDPKYLQTLAADAIRKARLIPMVLESPYQKQSFVVMRNVDIGQYRPIMWPTVCENTDNWYIGNGSCQKC